MEMNELTKVSNESIMMEACKQWYDIASLLASFLPVSAILTVFHSSLFLAHDCIVLYLYT